MESLNMRQLRFHMLVYLTTTHFFALLAVFHVPTADWRTVAFGFLMYYVGAMGITAGVHRLWSHRSYRASVLVRFVLMVCNSIANQGSIFHWSRDHRVHHKYSDTEKDPHNANRGFFFSHMGWLLVKKHPGVIAAGKELDLSDLLADSAVMLQLRLDPWWNLAWCFVMPTVVPAWGWGESVWTAFVLNCLRYVFTLHCTWLVNSAAHAFGTRPYDPNIKPAENLFVALFAAGEGWHNWHHKFPFDYATSEYGIASQFNPTKVFIDTLAWLGLVWDRKRATGVWEREQSRKAGAKVPNGPSAHVLPKTAHGA